MRLVDSGANRPGRIVFGASCPDTWLLTLTLTLQTFLRCVEIKVFNLEVKAKERLGGSVEMQSELSERR